MFILGHTLSSEKLEHLMRQSEKVKPQLSWQQSCIRCPLVSSYVSRTSYRQPQSGVISLGAGFLEAPLYVYV